jgi:hypothetical protein
MLKPLKSPQEPTVSRSELLQAIGELSVAFSDGTIDQLQPTGAAAVYTSSVTLWMLVMQRLASGNTLNAMVKDFIANRPAFCPQNRRLDEGTLSESSRCVSWCQKAYRTRDDQVSVSSRQRFVLKNDFVIGVSATTNVPTRWNNHHPGPDGRSQTPFSSGDQPAR